MILYHFTAQHLWMSIRKEGISLGAVPVVKYKKFRWDKKKRWLTSNSSFFQTWDTGNLIPYSRSDIRITVEVDNSKIIRWLDYCANYIDHPVIMSLNHQNYTPSDWWLHEGTIFPDQFREHERIRFT